MEKKEQVRTKRKTNQNVHGKRSIHVLVGAGAAAILVSLRARTRTPLTRTLGHLRGPCSRLAYGMYR